MRERTAPAHSDDQEQPPPAKERAKLRWDVSVWVLVNAVLTSIPVLVAGQPELLVYSAVVALMLTLVLVLTPPKRTARVGVVTGALLTFVAMLSAATADYPTAVVVTMIIVIYVSSLPRKPGPMVLGAMSSLAYLMYAWLGPSVMEKTDVGVLEIAIVSVVASAITIVAFLIGVWVLGKLKPSQLEDLKEIRDAEGTADPESGGGLVSQAWEFLGPANSMFRYALVRSLAVGAVFAVVFAERGDRSAFWVLLAMLLVSRPTGHAALKRAAQRTVATLIGVIVFLIALAVLQEPVMLAFALAILFVGLAYIERSGVVLTACATVFVIALSGAAQSDYVDWALARLVDTVIGAAIGVVVSVLGEARPSDVQ